MSNVAHTKVFYERIRSLRISDLRAYWKILNSDNHQKKRIVDAIIHDFVAEHYEKLWHSEEFLHTFDNETDTLVLRNII